MVGIERYGLTAGRDGFVEPAPARQRITEIAVGFGAVRIERDGLAGGGDGFVEPALAHQHIAEIAVSVSVVRVAGDGLTNQTQRRVQLSCLIRNHPQQVQRAGMLGLLNENLTIDMFGLGQTAGLMVLYREIEGLLDGHIWRGHGNEYRSGTMEGQYRVPKMQEPPRLLGRGGSGECYEGWAKVYYFAGVSLSTERASEVMRSS